MSTKSPSLDGIIQTKGAALRPDALPQRGAVPANAPAVGVSSASEPRAKSLTLRLSETQYQRLRRFAFDRNMSHQDVIESALMAHLNAHKD